MSGSGKSDTRLPEARLTVTTPSGPSAVGAAIRAELPSAVQTSDVFRHVAQQATERLVFVVPFFDAAGARLLCELFRDTPAKERILICREVDDLRAAAPGLDATLSALGVRIVTYRVAHYAAGGGVSIETFHAKIALADAACAYVGSANAMKSSLETTMECGFLVRGSAAAQVHALVSALVQACGGSR